MSGKRLEPLLNHFFGNGQIQERHASLKIIQYIPDFGLGGVQKAGCVLAEELAKSGHQTWVVAPREGPRYNNKTVHGCNHFILHNHSARAFAQFAHEIDADVVHIHNAAFQEDFIQELQRPRKPESRIVVSTPVFGRPPSRNEILFQTKVCCVGVYTFYRFCRWMRLDAEVAIKNGIAYVPLTPFTPPVNRPSSNDISEVVARRRAFGFNDKSFVFGRVGRNDVGKWHRNHESLINQVLSCCNQAVWLSIGFPYFDARRRLQTRWGGRFVDLAETSDYGLIAKVFSTLDVQVFMSRNGECFASTIAEAAGMGTPSVALINPLKDNGQAEQVISDVTGELSGNRDEMVGIICELAGDAGRLNRLKRSCELYAEHRWHVRQVSRDLLDLYSFWRQETSTPDYLQQMVDEHQNFSRSYRKNIIQLKGRTILHRVMWSILLAGVEQWTLFKMGRAVKRFFS